jgi:DNA polymerase III subunit delta'
LKVHQLSSYLSAAWKEGRLGHGLLLRTAESKASVDAIRQFFSEHLPETEREKFLRGQSAFADWTEVRPESDVITVDAIRSVLRTVGFPPQWAPFRLLVVSDAFAMNAQAANAFLKLLEEPPRDTFIVLISSMPLMATIESRCQCIRLQPLSAEEISVGSPPNGGVMAVAAEGSRKRWEELMLHEATWQRAEAELLSLWEASPRVPLSVSLWLEKIAEVEVQVVLSAWHLLLRDTVLCAKGETVAHRLGSECDERIRTLGKRLGPKGADLLAAKLPSLVEVQQALKQNAQEKLQMAALLGRLQCSEL